MRALALPLLTVALLTGCASHGLSPGSEFPTARPRLSPMSSATVPNVSDSQPPITPARMAASMRATCGCLLTRVSGVQGRSGFEVR